MKRLLAILLGIMSILSFMSCKNKEERFNEAMRKILEPFRTGPVFMDEDTKLAYDLYHAIRRKDTETVLTTLANGADPNYCLGECGWVDSNPLNVNAEEFFSTYHRSLRGEIIPNQTPDIKILNILIQAGADIDQRPYVWDIIHIHDNEDLNSLWGSFIINGKPIGTEEDTKKTYIQDINRLLEAFLQAGADPDKLGHPYPFSSEAMYDNMTDEKANEYFTSVEATTPLYEAIKKGMAWKSQVNLLLEYGATLNESCLQAAQESGDEAMLEKIQKLMKTPH